MRSIIHTIAVAASCSLVSTPGIAQAGTEETTAGPAIAQQVAPRDPTINRHLGFFIRPDIGFGYASSSVSAGSTSETISGAAGMFGIAIGGAVMENLILAGHIYSAVTVNPTVTVNGVSHETTNTDASMTAIGPELDYYFMPLNLYLSGTVAITKQSVRVNGIRADTDTGFGAQFAVGKEWWVSDHWGLGLAGRLAWSTNKDSGSNSPSWDAWGASALFSATYN